MLCVCCMVMKVCENLGVLCVLHMIMELFENPAVCTLYVYEVLYALYIFMNLIEKRTLLVVLHIFIKFSGNTTACIHMFMTLYESPTLCALRVHEIQWKP